MKVLTRTLMKMMLNKALNDKYKCDNEIVKRTYDDLIKSYKSTIAYLSI